MVLNKCILVLQDGKVFNGFSCGADGEAAGEIVFNTAVFGYQEIVTDPATAKQLICFAHPHVGDCGFNKEDFQSGAIQATGLFFKEYSRRYSNWRADRSMQDELIKENVVAMEGFDTRALVKYIREHGTQNAIVSTKDFDVESLKAKLSKVQDYDKEDIVKTVTCDKKYYFNENGSKPTIAVIDYGIPNSFLETFKSQGYKVAVFPATATADDILKENPKGIFLSSGPGYAVNSQYAVDAVKGIIKKSPNMPIFAIGFGSQVLALAYGAKVVKHKIGHRGANYPVRDIQTNKIAITSQDNGYYVDKDSIEQNENLQVTHINLYDNTVAGFANKKGNNFAVEFYPSLDSDETGYLVKNFFDMVEKNA
ncbi:MAG: glutamine-hydrolyzing carbamoyl-phosphate synthase small subunit [Elusimicrobia bacterium]|nr:glutamine-hydrolyzing carbamoyl-phosphate synthase small subunit [Elusimicrobiota bacterium]